MEHVASLSGYGWLMVATILPAPAVWNGRVLGIGCRGPSIGIVSTNTVLLMHQYRTAQRSQEKTRGLIPMSAGKPLETLVREGKRRFQEL